MVIVTRVRIQHYISLIFLFNLLPSVLKFPKYSAGVALSVTRHTLVQDKRWPCHGSIKAEEIVNGDMICPETLTYFTDKSLDHNYPITNESFTY